MYARLESMAAILLKSPRIEEDRRDTPGFEINNLLSYSKTRLRTISSFVKSEEWQLMQCSGQRHMWSPGRCFY
jgi:hypothetical protein